MIYLFIVGFVSTLGQVVLLRELSVSFYGVELIYSLALGIWMLWIAAGTAISWRDAKFSVASMNLLFVLTALLIPAEIAFIRAIRSIFSLVPGAYLPFEKQVLAMSLSLLPICLLLGLMFQRAARAYMERGKSLALAYAIESVGGIAGGMCATLLLAFELNSFQIALFCSLCPLALALIRREPELSRPIRGVLLASFGLLLALAWKSPAIDSFMTQWTHPDLLVTKDSPYGRLTITSMGGQVAIFENDALSFETEGTGAEELVHLAALHHSGPVRVLIAGGGLEGLLREVVKYKPSQVDYVELNPVLMKFAVPALPAELREPLNAPGVRVIIEDPRRFLAQSASYDLILVGMPEPSSGQANRFYTAEFFQQCSQRLNPNGVLAFSLQSSENFWTPQLTSRMVSIYRAAKAAFPDVIVLPGSINVVICAQEKLSRDAASLANRFAASGIRARLISPAYVQYVYGNDRFAELSRVLESGTTPANTDDRPICYQYTAMLWLSKFFPAFSSWDFWSKINRDGGSIAPGWVLVLVLPALLLLCRRKDPLRRALLMGLAGFIGMVLEISLILIYQVNRGILYQDLGLLLMSFMGGLSLGALSLDPGVRPPEDRRKTSRTRALALFAGLALVSVLMTLRVSWHPGTSLVVTSILLLAVGSLVGGIFAHASAGGAHDQGRLIRPLYAADLIGGCLGSLTASLVLIPIAGLGATALLMIPLILSALVLL